MWLEAESVSGVVINRSAEDTEAKRSDPTATCPGRREGHIGPQRGPKANSLSEELTESLKQEFH